MDENAQDRGSQKNKEANDRKRAEIEDARRAQAEDAARADLYGFFAQLLCSPIPVPEESTARDLIARAKMYIDQQEETETDKGSRDVAASFARFVDNARLRPLEDVQCDLAIARSMLFRGTQRERGPLPPCEGNYVSDRDEAAVQIAVSRFYQRFGGSCQKGERADYLGTECAFMSTLVAETARMRAQGNLAAEAAMGECAQAAFIERHLAWVPRFCDEARGFAREPFFAGVIALLKSFAEEERERARVLANSSLSAVEGV